MCNKVYLEDGAIKYTVIGDAEPRGICGSGLIDLLACLLETGDVDETGRLLAEDSRYYLTDSISVNGEDIRKLQLAKATISAGINTLLEYTGTDEDDITTFYLAGGFGNYLRLESAAGIGLFPESLKDKVVLCGNSSGAGAAMALINRNGEKAVCHAADICEYLELSDMKMFSDNYIDAMFFE